MTRPTSKICLFALILLSVSGTACKKRTAGTETAGGTILPVPEARGDNGWPRYDVPAEGFSLALPPDWRQFDMNPATFEKTLKEGMKSNPELDSVLANVRQQVTAGVKFFGIDPQSAKTGFATNVNVLRLPLPPGAGLDFIVSDCVTQFEKLPMVAKPFAHERIKTAAGDCERFRYKLSMRSPSGRPDTVAITQFIFVDAGNGYSVTLTTMPDREQQYLATFDKIGESFRFMK